MTSTSAAERDQFTVRGAYVYIPNTNISGTSGLNRLYNGWEHMNSLITNEGGYSLEGTLGYPWTSSTAVPGLTQIDRVVNGSGDHAGIKNGDSISGYTTVEHMGRYGYQRWNNEATLFNTLSAGGVTVKSNYVAGGALWSWVWGSTEFIDTYDYGRQMQTSMLWFDGGIQRNPTEAGSGCSQPSVQPYARQGSPVLNNHNSGSVQVTRSIPLEYNSDYWGGDCDHPVVYSGLTIGKNLTLDYNSMGPVAQYQTVVTSDFSVSDALIEIPTAYMPSSFNRYYTYDAYSQALTEVYPPTGGCTQGTNFSPSSGYGGVIISNSGQTRAMAVYGRSTTVNVGFTLWDFRSVCSTSKWNATAQFNLSSGSFTFNTYVMTGTLNDVVGYMRQLYLDGAN
jgi:hypothetical protein